MSPRMILLAVLPAGLLGIAAAAAVWLPGGSAGLGYLVGRRWGLG
ncbi:hypothetical protein [Streptomyces fradiae]